MNGLTRPENVVTIGRLFGADMVPASKSRYPPVSSKPIISSKKKMFDCLGSASLDLEAKSHANETPTAVIRMTSIGRTGSVRAVIRSRKIYRTPKDTHAMRAEPIPFGEHRALRGFSVGQSGRLRSASLVRLAPGLRSFLRPTPFSGSARSSLSFIPASRIPTITKTMATPWTVADGRAEHDDRDQDCDKRVGVRDRRDHGHDSRCEASVERREADKAEDASDQIEDQERRSEMGQRPMFGGGEDGVRAEHHQPDHLHEDRAGQVPYLPRRGAREKSPVPQKTATANP